jgi:hypothetical protein
MRSSLSLLLLLAACGAPAEDDAPDAAPPLDAPGVAGSCNVLYLALDGITVTQGAEDAPRGRSSIVQVPTANLPAYRGSVSDRDALVAQVRATLEPVGVSVVTDRPASGAYALIVVGGQGTDIGLNAELISVAPASGTPCAPIALGIGFAFEGGTPVQEANAIVGTYGAMHGVPLSADPADCMCYADYMHCDWSRTTACTIGGAGTPHDTTTGFGCDPGGATFDERATFLDRLACP